MRKITLVLLVMIVAIANTSAQISANCQNTCEIEKVVQKDAFLGVRIQGMRCTSSYHGVYIKDVLENTAAEKFGFQVTDVIISVDNHELFSTKELVDLIASYEPSDIVSILYKRNGKELEKDVVLGAKSTEIIKTTVCCDDNDTYFNDLNMNLYPNPAVSTINFSMENAEMGKYTFQIFNSIGEEVFVEVESFDAGFSKNIDLTKLSSGAYYMKVSKGANSFTKTFVIGK